MDAQDMLGTVVMGAVAIKLIDSIDDDHHHHGKKKKHKGIFDF